MATGTTRTAYFGTFVHSKSLEKLEISRNSVICVDEHGKIAAVERHLSSVFAVSKVLEKLGWTGDENVEGKPQVQHVEHVIGHREHAAHIHHEEYRHYDEHHSDDGSDSMEGLEHVGNGVHALENGVNGHSGTTNSHSTNSHVNGTTNGQVSKQRPEVTLVMCGPEEFFFPGFIGMSLSFFPFTPYVLECCNNWKTHTTQTHTSTPLNTQMPASSAKQP